MRPPYTAFTDTEAHYAFRENGHGVFFLALLKMYIGSAMKRPRVWVLMDEEDFKTLVNKAEKYESLQG